MNFGNRYIKLLLYVLLFVANVVLIFNMFPQRSHFNKKYEVGKPWKYELLTAPFDFPIYKTEDELRREQDSVKRYFTPYYKLSHTQASDAIESLKRDTLVGGNAKYYLQRALRSLYDRGVIADEDFNEFSRLGVAYVNISDSSNIWQRRKLADMLTPNLAKDYISKNYPLTKAMLDTIEIERFLCENLSLDKNKSDLALADILKNIPMSDGVVQAGEKIIDRGEIVKSEQMKILNSLKREYDQHSPDTNNTLVDIATLLTVAGLLSLFFIYIILFRQKFIRLKNALFVVLMNLLIAGAASLIIHFDPNFINIVPFTLLAVIIRIFFDSRTALFIHNILVLVIAIFVPYPFIFVLLHITAGMMAVSTLKQLTHRGQLVQSAVLVFFTYSVVYTLYTIIETGAFDLSWQPYLNFAINALLMLFAYVLIYIFEKLFGYLSDVTLVELSNINNKLLMEFASKAPGSFQHVIQVSTLSAAIAQKINANTLLTRTGALYHDIGKMKNPMCFTENQVNGINPLNNMSYEEAARVIISHVSDGVKIAEQNGLPRQIIRFITSHHGNRTQMYFYTMAKNAAPDQEISKEAFSYHGSLPATKEEAIVMMADSVEAASRSLKEYNEDTIGDLVERIVGGQIADQAFKNSPMTFRQVEVAKQVMKENLLNIYHSRVEYPKSHTDKK